MSSGLTLSPFHVGLGLTAAAHVHLANRSRVKSRQSWSEYEIHHQLSQLDILMQTLTDLHALSEIITSVDSVLARYSSSSPLRRRMEVRRTRSQRDSTKGGEAIEAKTSSRHPEASASSSHQHHQQRHQTRSSQQSKEKTTGTKNKLKEVGSQEEEEEEEEASTTHVDAGQGSTDKVSQDTSQDGKGKGSHQDNIGRRKTESASSASSSRRQKSLRYSNSRESAKEGKADPVEISCDEIEGWISAYKDVRESQEKCMKRAVAHYTTAPPSFFQLRKNLCLSMILSATTMYQHISTTKRFYSFYSTYISGIQSWCARLFPRYIPQPSRSAWSSNNNSSGALTGPASSGSIVLMGLPLLPALCLSGMHLLAAARCQVALFQMRGDLAPQRKAAKHMSLLSGIMKIREKRLAWIVKEIREYESEEAKLKQEEEAKRHVEGTESDETAGPSSSATGPSNQRNIATTTTTVHSASRSKNSMRWRQKSRIDPELISYGADLERVNLELFMRDPFERARVLQQELDGMRFELRFLKSGMVSPE